MQRLRKAYLGSTEIPRAYLGNTLVYNGLAATTNIFDETFDETFN